MVEVIVQKEIWDMEQALLSADATGTETQNPDNKWGALGLTWADDAARALWADLSMAGMQHSSVSVWLWAQDGLGILSALSNLVLKWVWISRSTSELARYSQPEADSEELGSVSVKQQHLLSLK